MRLHFPLALALAAGPAAAQQPILIRNVTVIDGTGAPPRPAQSVALEHGLIREVGPTALVRTPPGARVIDGAGRFLLPGFIDLHAHYAIGPVTMDTSRTPPVMKATYDPAGSREALRTLLAYGITTIRNPGGNGAVAVAIRDSVRLGLVPGPRIFTAGDVIDAIDAPGLTTSVHTEAEVRVEVARQAAQGVDYVKLYASLPPALIRAGIDEAHRRGVRAIGHLFATSWTDAADAGIDGIVHIAPGNPGLLADSARRAFVSRFRGTQFMLEWFGYADFEGPEIRRMLASLVAHQVFVDPTLVTFEAIAWGDSARIREAPTLGLAPTGWREGWRRFDLTAGWKPEDFAEARRVWPRVLAFAKLLHDAGVPLTAGTDMGNPWTVPGESFHRELELLVAAGIPPLEVLRIATRNGARSLGIEGLVGTIARGKVADLVLLDADPLAAIGNTRRIDLVIQAGRVLRPAAFLPARVRTAAAPR